MASNAPGAFFVRDGDRFVPSDATTGPWDPDAQHAGPPCALLGRAIERCEPRDGMRVGRITCEILGPVPLEPLTVEAGVVRPGRSVELLEASLAGPGGELVRARAWRLQAGEHALDPVEEPPRPARTPAPTATSSHRSGGRLPHGDGVPLRPRRIPGTRAGNRLDADAGAAGGRGGADSAAARARGGRLGNGVSAALDYQEYLFINTDLSVHLLRPPAGEWVCLDAVTHVDGLGLSDTALWDERGHIGRAAQTLLVRRRRIGED